TGPGVPRGEGGRRPFPPRGGGARGPRPRRSRRRGRPRRRPRGGDGAAGRIRRSSGEGRSPAPFYAGGGGAFPDFGGGFARCQTPRNTSSSGSPRRDASQ